MSADTGVGPSIASGSHEWSGSWADFPVAPKNSATQMSVSTPCSGALSSRRRKTSPKFNDPKTRKITMMPIVYPQSPIRFITNAFFAAKYGSGRSNQYPMRR